MQLPTHFDNIHSFSSLAEDMLFEEPYSIPCLFLCAKDYEQKLENLVLLLLVQEKLEAHRTLLGCMGYALMNI